MNLVPIDSEPLAKLLGVKSSSFTVKFDDNFRPLSLRLSNGGKTNLLYSLYEDEVQLLSDAVRHIAMQSINSFNIINRAGIVPKC